MKKWTKEEHKKLLTLRYKGVSFSEIAKTMGISKNAAVGTWHRLHPKRGAAMSDESFLKIFDAMDIMFIKNYLKKELSINAMAMLLKRSQRDIVRVIHLMKLVKD